MEAKMAAIQEAEAGHQLGKLAETDPIRKL